jgi:tRNA pseudouridine38-40 synthase
MEDARTATAGSTKRRSEQDTPPSSPKRVKVDVQSNKGANSNADTAPQDNKKLRKRRDAAGYAKSRQGKEKDGKNAGRRRRHAGDGPDTNQVEVGAEADPPDVPEKAPRLPKRQSAILLGFCGTGCAGMQMSVHAYLFR